MLTKLFKPLALAFLVNLIISVEDKIKYNICVRLLGHPDIFQDMLFYFVDYNYCVKWKGKMSEVGFYLKPGETDCDLNAAP